MHPALRKGPLFTKKHPPISFPAYGPESVVNVKRGYDIQASLIEFQQNASDASQW